MQKLIYQDDQEALVKAAGAMVHVFAPGELAGNIKKASATSLSDDTIQLYLPDKDHFLIHAIAMGSTEMYGYNRNADGYKEATLRRDHPTFVSDGHYFEEHRNRDPKKKRGDIKFSFYNPEMHRVELLIHADKQKAEEDYEMAKAGKSLSFSMSCKISHDVCNCCQHKAARIKDHCSHIKESPGQYLPEFEKYAYVDNPFCKFFDISKVKNPADRVAHYLAYKFPDGEMAKAASEEGLPILGSEWAEFEGVTLPNAELEPLEWGAAHRAALTKLAAEYSYVAGMTPDDLRSRQEKVAFANSVGPNLFEETTDEILTLLRKVQPATLMREFGKQAAVLPFDAFFAYVTDRPRMAGLLEDENYKASCACMGRALETLMGGESSCGNIHSEFEPASEWGSDTDPGKDDMVQDFMDEAVKAFGIQGQPAQGRVITITIKTAGDRTLDKVFSSEKAASAEKMESKDNAFYAQAYVQYLTQALVNADRLGSPVKESGMTALASYLNFIEKN